MLRFKARVLGAYFCREARGSAKVCSRQFAANSPLSAP